MKQEAQLIAVTTPTLPIRLIQALLLTAIGFMVAQLLSYDYRKSLPESRIDVNKVYFNRESVFTLKMGSFTLNSSAIATCLSIFFGNSRA